MQKNMRMEQLEYFGIPSYIIRIWKKHYSPTLLPVQEEAIRQYNLLQPADIHISNIQNQALPQNLLIISPSSSGKTLVGEIAAIQNIIFNKKIIFLVPLRILAEEKYLHFLRLYHSIGLKIKISSRDHRHDDRDIIRGHFHIAVIVYEKFYYMFLQYPRLLKNISLLIADEIQLINDAQRGPGLEKIFKYLLCNHLDIRIIGLSAFMENTKALAELLNARILFSSYRPVELRKGIVRKGIYQYIEHNTSIKGKEVFFPEDYGLECNLAGYLKATLDYLVRQDETNLIFFPTRREVRIWSKWLASQFTLPSSRRAIDELYSMEHTTSQEELIELLQNGIAYHCANLSWQERHLIEEELISRNIKIICATDTLSMGINLPVNNVILTGQKIASEKIAGKTYSSYRKRELTLAEVENMGGRAGRFNSENRFGRIIFLAPSLIELTAYQKLYFNNTKTKTLSSPLLQDQLLQITQKPFNIQDNYSGKYSQEQKSLAIVNPALSNFDHHLLIKTKVVKNRDDIFNYLLHNIALEPCGYSIANIFSNILNGNDKYKKSFWNYQFPKELDREEIQSILYSLAKEQLIRICNGKSCYITEMGKMLVSRGISLQTFVHFHRWLIENEPESMNELEIIFLVADSPDGRELSVPCPNFARSKWREYLRMRFLNLIFDQGISHKAIFQINLNKSPGNQLIQCKNPNLEGYMTMRRVLLMSDWLSNRELKKIEEDYGILSGSVQKIGEGFSWLVDTLAAIAVRSGWKEQRPSDLEKIYLLSERLSTGITPEGMGLARLKIPGLTRGYIQRLVQEGYDSEECLQELNSKKLCSLLPIRVIDKIHNYLFPKDKKENPKKINLPKKQKIHTKKSENCTELTNPVININSKRPDRISFFGEEIPVNQISFRLISFLGKNQGKVLTYYEIINHLWPDDEDATYHRLWYHLGKIRSCMQKIIQEKDISNRPNDYIKEKIIKVFPGRGILLNENISIKMENNLKV